MNLAHDEIQVWNWRLPRPTHWRIVLDILGHYIGRPLKDAALLRTARGKPFVSREPGAPPLEFTLSHCGDMGILAVSREPAGIDIEQVEAFADLEAAAEYCLGMQEAIRFARALPGDRAAFFYRCWTRKEAYLKARGIGLAIEPREVDTTRDTLDGTWHLRSAPSPEGCVAAIATPIAEARVIAAR